jgi:type VI secretion system protein ImpG
MLSHLHLNLVPLISAGALKEMLALYAIPNDPDPSRKLSNQSRIGAIHEARAVSEDYFVRGLPIRGNRVSLTLDRGGFASRGDLLIFGNVMDRFFGLFHHLNSYSRLNVSEKNSHEVYRWPPRLGAKPLL